MKNQRLPVFLLYITCLVFSLVLPLFAKADVQTIIFEEKKIEGKIRRPQLVLITADQRPAFTPMILQSLGKNANITSTVNESIIEDSPYKKAFRFEGTKIINYSP
jgi:hypothetical protein